MPLATWAGMMAEAGVFTAAEATAFDASLAEAAVDGTFAYRVDLVVTHGRRRR